ncbi:hypothetical protein C8J56DRAFT_1140345 [Mycena floridula]|nr:hypothetical protein C8J56DRAFT_1140345 [Mycena floridula]
MPEVISEDLSGKTVALVGANTGIGFEAVKHFAKMNPARMILGCRSEEKGRTTVEKLKSQTGYNKAEFGIIDLSNFASVQAFADGFKGRLDILVMNAAAGPIEVFAQSVEGWENTIQINNLSTSLLSILLLPHMQKTAQDHNVTTNLVIVASEIHYFVDIEDKVRDSPRILEKLSQKEYCTSGIMAKRYMVSKLLNVLFVRALSQRVPKSIVVTAPNPGFTVSELGRNITGFKAFLGRIMQKLMAHTTEEGSRQLVWAALAGGGQVPVDTLRGAFIHLSQVLESSDFVISDVGKDVQERVWNETVEILTKFDPKVAGILDSL